MPGLDRRGPTGAGPMTGGRRGLCGRTGVTPAYGGSRFGWGRGFRGGLGFQSGFRRHYQNQPTAPPAEFHGYEDGELEMLKAEQNRLQRSLEAIARKIDELDDDNLTP